MNMIRLLKLPMNPGWRAVMLFRAASWAYRHQLEVLSVLFNSLNIALHGCDIFWKARIGQGLTIYHPVGIVIGACEAGGNLCVGNGVTIGNREKRQVDGRENPRIGNNVVINAGAVVIGPITIGNNVTVAPNAVVIDDVRDGLVVGGIPARQLTRRNTEQTRSLPL
jgi:serine O-acetyltransferase